MGKLTVKSVAALNEPGRYSDQDGSGFHLRVDGQGRKYWLLRTQVDGKRRDVNIGSVARMSLATARARAQEVLTKNAEKGAFRSFKPTFAEAVGLAHAARTDGYKNEKHIAQWRTTLETYANPSIGGKYIDTVDRADVVGILSPIWLTKPETARRVLQRIDRVMRWAVGNEHRADRIDMDLVRDALPRQPQHRATVRHMPSIPWEEAPAFYRQIHDSRSAPEVRWALSLLMLTAVRPGNMRSAKREQFDLNSGVWLVPAGDMKSGRAHRVPLSQAAVRIVTTAMAAHDYDRLFTVKGGEFSPDTLRMAMRRLGRSEVPHGFRSTFKEWSRHAGYADHLSEQALAHLDPNEVRAAYARHDMLEVRRPMMVAWASFLEGTPHTP